MVFVYKYTGLRETLIVSVWFVCLLVLESFTLFVGQENLQRLPCAEKNQCVIEVSRNTLQPSTYPNPQVSNST